MQTNTVELMQLCYSGAKMATGNIQHLIPYVHNEEMGQSMRLFIDKHDTIARLAQQMLAHLYRKGKEPNPIASFMAKTVTDWRLCADSSDDHIARMLVESCQKGSRMLAEKKQDLDEASDRAKELADALLALEDEFCSHMKRFTENDSACSEQNMDKTDIL